MLNSFALIVTSHTEGARIGWKLAGWPGLLYIHRATLEKRSHSSQTHWQAASPCIIFTFSMQPYEYF